MIFDEVVGGYFCILVDESQNESKKEQMALILRYVKNDGLLGEWFFDIMGVENTSALTLKKEISNILSRFNLPIQNMRGQGYDGASNMRGKWNGLQALFLKDCLYAYYVDCFAHCLQLALIAATKDEPNVWQFFSHLSCIVNLVASSLKCIGELKSFHRSEVENMLASVVESLKKSTNQQIRGQANGVYKDMKSYRYRSLKQLKIVWDRTSETFKLFVRLSDKIEEIRIIEKILKSRSSKFEHVVVAIEESKDFNDLTIDEL
ncbi:zinc finger MYM-type protein 1-like [Camellia sinensis]|uniref:zinc finger MYM-type protein 1-like n=1 Tax=Camellia sinensis TaxID=4442 RepID=UPI001036AFC5|nr:zinc finger MYM-type protein 1-like [Camellia sinensis]